jgi:hypothetical protein
LHQLRFSFLALITDLHAELIELQRQSEVKVEQRRSSENVNRLKLNEIKMKKTATLPTNINSCLRRTRLTAKVINNANGLRDVAASLRARSGSGEVGASALPGSI